MSPGYGGSLPHGGGVYHRQDAGLDGIGQGVPCIRGPCQSGKCGWPKMKTAGGVAICKPIQIGNLHSPPVWHSILEGQQVFPSRSIPELATMLPCYRLPTIPNRPPVRKDEQDHDRLAMDLFMDWRIYLHNGHSCPKSRIAQRARRGAYPRSGSFLAPGAQSEHRGQFPSLPVGVSVRQ